MICKSVCHRGNETDIQSSPSPSPTQTRDIPAVDTTLVNSINACLPTEEICTETNQTNELKQFKENNDSCPQCIIKD